MSLPAGSEEEKAETLPRRDWILLPLVVLTVIFTLLGGAEGAARILFRESGEFTCGVRDAAGIMHQKPNCVAYYKNAEGPLVEYRFNECGFRSSKPCGPKPPNTLRVALIGTSITMGLYVPAEETFAVRTEKALNRACRCPVEVQNMGAMESMLNMPVFAAESLRLSPDVVVLTVVPFDVQQFPEAGRPAPQEPASGIQSAAARFDSAWDDFKLKIRAQRSVFAAAHFMLLNQDILYQTFLTNGASRDLMSNPPTPAGERAYAHFAYILDSIMAKLAGSGVPLVVMIVPNRIGAAIVSNHAKVDGADPYRFGRRLSEIVSRRGAIPIDMTPDFAAVPQAERLYYPVDNHPMSGAHAIMARVLVRHLTGGSVPRLAAVCAPDPEGN